MTMKRTLYICYFGLREPLVQTQVLPYLREIVKGGMRADLVTFEPNLKTEWTSEQIVKERRSLLDQGIGWDCLAYHKWPSALATAWDIFAGVLFVRRKIARDQIDVLHGRVHLPTLIGALARKFSRRKPKLIFDIRGFFPEEYTDAGVWPSNGLLYRAAKRVERWLLRESDGFVVLTEKAREVLFPESALTGSDHLGRPVEVIPCCVDLVKRFPAPAPAARESARNKLGLDGRFVIVHIGALGGLYLTGEIVDFMAFSRSRDESTFAMLLTQSDTTEVMRLLADRGFAGSDRLVGRVGPDEISEYLGASDVALSFVKSTFATLSRSPTKIPEYLAAGLPIIANTGVGDVDELIRDKGVGALIENFKDESYERALNEIGELRKEAGFEQRCFESAAKGFDLGEVGGKRYLRLYRRLLTDEPE